jgi:hypothetical protein
MQAIDTNNIIEEYIFNITKKISPIKATQNILDYCKSLESTITELSLLEILKMSDELYKSIGLMKLLYSDVVYEECDRIVDKYLTNLFSNSKIYKKIKYLKEHNSSQLINNIYKNFIESKNSKLSTLNNNINNLQHNILIALEEPVIMSTMPEMKHDIPSLPADILLTDESYTYLQKAVKNSECRKIIEDMYFSKTDAILDDFAKLIYHRYTFAKILGCDSYFEYVKKNGSVKSVIDLINDLAQKIETRSKKETTRIYAQLTEDNNNKINQCDMLYYYEKMRSTCLFKPVDVLRVLFDISRELFGIVFTYDSKYKQKTWKNKLLICKVNVIDGDFLGYVFFDLRKTHTKKIKNPLCVKIANDPTKICLVTSYDDINAKCMDYLSIVSLFKEFGCVLQMITKNKNDKLCLGNDFDILMSFVMEYVAWDDETIKKICEPLHDDTIVHHIIFNRHINLCNSIKFKCINALFDNILHNSHELISLLSVSFNNKSECSPGNVIKMLYKRVYSNILSSQSDMINVNVSHINPSTILQEIGGKEGNIYNNILTEILAYAVYTLVKNDQGNNFVVDVLSAPSSQFKQSLNSFISKSDTDSYDLFLNNIIEYKEIDTEENTQIKEKINNSNSIMTDTSANYFDDCSDDNESDDDSDNIICIK